jgi:hypothetical protein
MTHLSPSPTGTILTLHGQRIILDLADIPAVSGYTWRLIGKGYPARTVVSGGIKATTYLHRLLASTSGDLETHHENGNRLDARRTNIRPLPYREHVELHRSRGPQPGRLYKGVMYIVRKNRWQAQVRVRGQLYRSPFCHSAAEAAVAYDQLLDRLGLTLAYRNFPEDN